MSVDLADDEIQDTVEKYQDLMRSVGVKTALREIGNTDVDVESLSHKQKYIITHAPFPDAEIRYKSETIDSETVGDLLGEIVFHRSIGKYEGYMLDLTRKGLLCRAILIATEDIDSYHTYEQKVEIVR